MFFLPRRWVRQLTYIGLCLGFVSVVALIANKNRYIHLEHYIPVELMPQYFQPPSDAYIVDLSIRSCSFFNVKAAECGLPNKADGLYGDTSEFGGGWSKINKDLLLGSLWLSRRYLFSKKMKPEYFENHRDAKAIHLIWVGTNKDCEIKGNKECIPFEVLKDFLNNHPFDNEDYKYLVEANKGTKLRVATDKSKSAHKYNSDFIKSKEKAQKLKEEAESQRTKEEAQGLKTEDPELKNPESKDPETNGINAKDSETKDTEIKGANAKDQKVNKADAEHPDATDKSKKSEKRHSDQPGQHLVHRSRETSRHNLKNYMVIPTKKQLEDVGWKKVGNSIWVKYGPADSRAITGVNVLFGPDAVDPRPNWNLLPNPLLNTGAPSHALPRISFRVGPRVDYKSSAFLPALKFDKDGKFKILQVADLHFSTGVGKCRDPVPAESKAGCEADPRTLRFLNQVLDLEKPDFVVLTGDQVFGQAAPDPETALFKAVLEFIERKIPYAITLGNHDDESNMSREQMMTLASLLPFSVAGLGPQSVDGFGNYAVTIEGRKNKNIAAALYFLDSHSNSKQPKTNPGYDWFKESQINWVGMEAESLLGTSHKSKNEILSMAFFHIPIPEFRDTHDKPMMGMQREGVAAPRYHTDMRSAFSQAGILVASVGHDHANDYCLLNTDDKNSESQHNMWLCYGGGAGEGGYGGYNGYIRRLRVYELDQNNLDINTWKRAENDPGFTFDLQKVVESGTAVDHVRVLQ